MSIEKPREKLRDTNYAARVVALDKYAQQSVVPTSLVKYESRGKLVIIGEQQTLEYAQTLDQRLHISLLIKNGGETINDSENIKIIKISGHKLKVDGYLGDFTISLMDDKNQPTGRHISCDLILDLSEQPVCDLVMPPNGYFHSTMDPQSLETMATQLADMIGTFEKPIFISYESDICAHNRSGKIACTKCLDTCPAQAISSIAEQVKVDTYLCQGGGVCATVCPTGAMQYAYPSSEDLLKNLRLLIRIYTEQGGQQPIIVFFADADGGNVDIETVLDGLPLKEMANANIVPVMIEELASVGMEVWLSLLAYGAQSVRVVHRGQTDPSLINELNQQLVITEEILAAMGYPRDLVKIVSPQTLRDSLEIEMPPIEQASFAAMGGKRQTAYFAIDHLYEQATRPRKLVMFSVPAMFGSAHVEESCTLCHSCVTACPGKALQTGEGVPQLKFIEANCVQCGMCTRTCPENAISITSRLIFDREKRQKSRILYEESPFHCISCGKPFATRSVIEGMLAKLSDHWMFKTERAKDRLKMCEDCRVVDVVQDDAAMGGDKEQSLH